MQASSPRNLVRSTDFSPKRNSFTHHRLNVCGPGNPKSSDCTWHPCRRGMFHPQTDPLPSLGQKCDPWKNQHRQIFHGKKGTRREILALAKPGKTFVVPQSRCDTASCCQRDPAELDKGGGCSSSPFSVIPSQTRLGCCTLCLRAGKPCAKPAREIDGPGGWDRTFGRSKLPLLILGRSWLLRLALEWESVKFPSQLLLVLTGPSFPS